MNRLLVLVFVVLLAGCSTFSSNVIILPDGTEVRGKAAIQNFLIAQSASEARAAPNPCAHTVQPEAIDFGQLAELSAAGQAAYMNYRAEQARSAETCHTAMLVASARDNPLTAQGEVAQQGYASYAASERASADKWRAGARVVSTLGGIWLVGEVLDSAMSNAGHNTYQANNNTFSQSTNTSGMGGHGGGEGLAGGSPGGGLSVDASGSRTMGITQGGDSVNAVQDRVLSSPQQTFHHAGEKPYQIEGPIENSGIDNDDVQTDAALF